MTNQRLTMFVMESSKQQPVGASLLAIWAAEFSSAPRTSALPVRPGGRTYSGESPCRGKSRPVAGDNRVAAMRGGQQSEANWRSVGNELDSAANSDERAGSVRV